MPVAGGRRSIQNARIVALETRQQNIVAHRKIHDEAERALARHEADIGGDGVGGCGAGRRGHRRDGFACARRTSEQAAHDPVAAAAEQAGEADGLACAHRHAVAALGGLLEQRLARRDRLRQTTPAPSCRSCRSIRSARRRLPRALDRDHLAVAQHGAAVGERDHLVEAMRDIDDGGALLLHAVEHGEQPLDLAISPAPRSARRG